MSFGVSIAGFYDTPHFNPLTGKASVPDYRRIIDAVARRDQSRMLVDGMTAANDLGLSDAVPGRIVIHTDARTRPIHIGKQTITCRPTAPSKLSGLAGRRCALSRHCTGCVALSQNRKTARGSWPCCAAF